MPPVREPSASSLCYVRQSALSPPVMRDKPVIGGTLWSRVTGAHMRKKGRNQHVILGAQTVQLTELQRVGEWLGGLSTLPPSRPLYMPQSTMDDPVLRADCRHNGRNRPFFHILKPKGTILGSFSRQSASSEWIKGSTTPQMGSRHTFPPVRPCIGTCRRSKEVSICTRRPRRGRHDDRR